MNALEFASSLVSSLAWPAAVTLLVMRLRKPLTKMLNARAIKTFEAGPAGIKMDFFDEKLEDAQQELKGVRQDRPGQGVADVETPREVYGEIVIGDDFMQEMKQLAEVAPPAAILTSFAKLENALRRALDELDASASARIRRASPRQLARMAVEHKLLAPEELAAFDDVAVLRNVVAHGGVVDLDLDRAVSYVSIVRQLIISIRLAGGHTAVEGGV